MQLSAVLLLVLLGLVVWNPWLAAAGVMAHLYSARLAGWDEGEDLRRRIGHAWTEYRRGPNLRHLEDQAASREVRGLHRGQPVTAAPVSGKR